jgi:hypothetical protein
MRVLQTTKYAEVLWPAVIVLEGGLRYNSCFGGSARRDEQGPLQFGRLGVPQTWNRNAARQEPIFSLKGIRLETRYDVGPT